MYGTDAVGLLVRGSYRMLCVRADPRRHSAQQQKIDAPFLEEKCDFARKCFKQVSATGCESQGAASKQPSTSNTSAFRESAGPGIGTEQEMLSTRLAVNISSSWHFSLELICSFKRNKLPACSTTCITLSCSLRAQPGFVAQQEEKKWSCELL